MNRLLYFSHWIQSIKIWNSNKFGHVRKGKRISTILLIKRNNRDSIFLSLSLFPADLLGKMPNLPSPFHPRPPKSSILLLLLFLVPAAALRPNCSGPVDSSPSPPPDPPIIPRAHSSAFCSRYVSAFRLPLYPTSPPTPWGSLR